MRIASDRQWGQRRWGGRAAAGERRRAPDKRAYRSWDVHVAGRAGGRRASRVPRAACLGAAAGEPLQWDVRRTRSGRSRAPGALDTWPSLVHTAAEASATRRTTSRPADDFPTANGRDEDVQGIVLRSEGVEECINVLRCSSVDGPASAIGICLRNPTELAHIGHRAWDIEQIVHRQCVAARSCPASWQRRSTIAGRHASRHSEMDGRGSTIDAALSRVDDRGHRGSMVDRSMGDRTAESH